MVWLCRLAQDSPNNDAADNDEGEGPRLTDERQEIQRRAANPQGSCNYAENRCDYQCPEVSDLRKDNGQDCDGGKAHSQTRNHQCAGALIGKAVERR